MAFTDADAEVVARAEFDHDQSDRSCDEPAITWDEAMSFVRREYLDRARAGLTALATAGRSVRS